MTTTHPAEEPGLAQRDPLVIGLCGHAGAGKDSVASVLVKEFGFVQVAFADPIKDMLGTLMSHADVDAQLLHTRQAKEAPIEALRGASPRLMMQRLGDWGRSLAPDFWVRLLAQRIGLAHSDPGQWAPVHDRIVISDVRFPDEALWLTDVARGALMHVQRPSAAPVRSHISEMGLNTPAMRQRVCRHIVNESTLHTLSLQVNLMCWDLGIEQRSAG